MSAETTNRSFTEALRHGVNDLVARPRRTAGAVAGIFAVVTIVGAAKDALLKIGDAAVELGSTARYARDKGAEIESTIQRYGIDVDQLGKNIGTPEQIGAEAEKFYQGALKGWKLSAQEKAERRAACAKAFKGADVEQCAEWRLILPENSAGPASGRQP
jgi:hypothetical protein